MPGRGQRDAPVRDELGAVDGDPRAVRVRERRELGQGQALAGDVRRAGDGQQRGGRRAPARLDAGRVSARVAAPDTARARGAPARAAGWRGARCPGAPPGPGHCGGEQVERVGGVPGEDHDVVGAGADERGERRPGGLVGAGADGGGVPGAAVHARVERQQLCHPVGDGALRTPNDVGRRLPVPVGNGPRPHPGHPLRTRVACAASRGLALALVTLAGKLSGAGCRW